MSRPSQVGQAWQSGCNRDTGEAAPRPYRAEAVGGAGRVRGKTNRGEQAPRATLSAVTFPADSWQCRSRDLLVNRAMGDHQSDRSSANQDPGGYFATRRLPLLSDDVSLLSAKLEGRGFKRMSGRLRHGRQPRTSCKHEANETGLANGRSTSEQSERDKHSRASSRTIPEVH